MESVLPLFCIALLFLLIVYMLACLYDTYFRGCYWCGRVSKESVYDVGMTRPGYVGVRKWCSICAKQHNVKPIEL
jgi:hypothetical protein